MKTFVLRRYSYQFWLCDIFFIPEKWGRYMMILYTYSCITFMYFFLYCAVNSDIHTSISCAKTLVIHLSIDDNNRQIMILYLMKIVMFKKANMQRANTFHKHLTSFTLCCVTISDITENFLAYSYICVKKSS